MSTQISITPSGKNIGNSDLTIDSSGARKLILGGASSTDSFTIMDSTDSADILKVTGDKRFYFNNGSDNTNIYLGATGSIAYRTIYMHSSSYTHFIQAYNNQFAINSGYYLYLKSNNQNVVQVSTDRMEMFGGKNFRMPTTSKYEISGAGAHKMILGGALSTDGFSIRNSTDTADLLSTLGNGDVIVGSQTGGTASNTKALRIDSSGFSKLHFNTSYNATSTPTAEITINRRQATFVDDNVWMFQQRPFADGNNKSYKTYYINPSSYYGTAASIANEGYVAGWSWFANSRTDANRLMKLSIDGALNLYNRPALPIETNFVDSFQLYSADITAGNAAPHFRTEGGDVIKLYKESALTASDGTLANAVTRIAELEARLQSLGLLA